MSHRILGAGIAALLCAGCMSPGPPLPIGDSMQFLTERIHLFLTPKELRDETMYPPGATHQILRWKGECFNWVITFPAEGYAYAGITLRRPADLHDCMNHGQLIFTVCPLAAATNLTVALVDGDQTPLHVMVHQPVTAKPMLLNSDIGIAKIPLPGFPSRGVVLDAPSPEASSADFDAADIREIRILTAGGLAGQPFTVGQLRIEH